MRKTRSQDSHAKERMNIQKFISEIQLKINQRFIKNHEKSQQKSEALALTFNNKVLEVNEALSNFQL